MHKESVQIENEGIRRTLRKYTREQALCEYIWNGFDAGATNITIELTKEDITERLTCITITDNGHGIDQAKLNTKFKPFLHSDKAALPERRNTNGIVKGQNGIGRLTFFHFADTAKWTTIFSDGNTNFKYNISIQADDLKNFNASAKHVTDESTGTSVEFLNIFNLTGYNKNSILEHIRNEFAWFITLNEKQNFAISLNSETITFDNITHDSITETISISNHKFSIRIVVWTRQLNKEYSKFYYSDENGTLKHRETTSFNRQGDDFHHSVYVTGSYFNSFKYSADDTASKELDDFHTTKSDIFKDLKGNLYQLLSKVRRSYVEKGISTLIGSYESQGIFPTLKGNNYLDAIRHGNLKALVGGLYKIEPKLFSSLSTTQKKTFVRLLDTIQLGHNVEELFCIIKEVLDLSSDQTKELNELLQTTTLSSVIKTIKVIKDRFHAIEILDNLAFNKDRGANEVHHIQKFVEEHYWIFGEQYNLVTAAEPSFEEALRRLLYHLHGEKHPKGTIHIDNNDRKKEPDIVLIRQDLVDGKRKCILVELKHPNKALGDKELSQVKKYMNVVCSEDRFNGDDITWEFHLVGNRLSKTNQEIPSGYQTAKHYGKRRLVNVNSTHNYEIFVHLWSDIKVELEHRLHYLQAQLELQREKLTIDTNLDANDLICLAKNSASLKQLTAS